MGHLFVNGHLDHFHTLAMVNSSAIKTECYLFKILTSVILDKYSEVDLLDHVVSNNQGNANQNQNEILPHTCQNAIDRKIKDKCLWGCGDKGTRTQLGGMQNGAAVVENSTEVPQIIKQNYHIQNIFTWKWFYSQKDVIPLAL